MFRFIDAPEGWFYSEKFNYWQKTNDRIVVYVSELLFGYQVQLYYRGQISFCELEARTSEKTEEGYKKMFVLGEKWLEAYHDADCEKINNDPFHISNPNGVWIKEAEKEKIFNLSIILSN